MEHTLVMRWLPVKIPLVHIHVFAKKDITAMDKTVQVSNNKSYYDHSSDLLCAVIHKIYKRFDFIYNNLHFGYLISASQYLYDIFYNELQRITKLYVKLITLMTLKMWQLMRVIEY